MAKLFLGSVGYAEAFEIVDGNPVVAFTSKTLTDSQVLISATNDAIRAGTGAPVVYTFSHDATAEVNLTDVIFKTAYVEAQLGGEFSTRGAKAYKSVTKTTNDSGVITLDDVPQDIRFNCIAATAIAWVKAADEDEYHVATVAGSTVTGLTANKEYCVRYLAVDNSAIDLIVKSNIIPKEYMLIITCPLYAGDACSASNGKPAGSITFEIPRFKLNGSQDFSMNMSSNSTMSLAGQVMAADSGCKPEEGSELLRVIVREEGTNLATDLTDLVAESETGDAGELVPDIYAIYGTKTKKIDLSDLTITPDTAVDLATGKFAAGASGAVKFALGDKEETITVS